MKKRGSVLAGVLCMAMALSAGCSGNTGSGNEETKEETKAEKAEEKISEEDEYLSWIQDALEQYEKEKIREIITESTDTREDGSTVRYKTIEVIDTEKQQVMLRHEFPDDQERDAYIEYYTKEGETDYWYTDGYQYNDAGEQSIIPLKVKDLDENYLKYSSFTGDENGGRYESNENRDISEIKVSKEGEEKINNVSVLKFKVEYKQQWKDAEMMTRESLLEEQELTEEDVAMLEGFSDKMDAYVAQSNKWTEEASAIQEVTETVYITSDEHKIERIESEDVYETNTEEEDILINEFWNGIDKLHFLKDRLAEGIGRDDALRMMNEAYSDDIVTDDEPKAVSFVNVENYVTGDQCEPVGELPADTKEITLKQYQDGEY